jgi:hypothetical protein
VALKNLSTFDMPGWHNKITIVNDTLSDLFCKLLNVASGIVCKYCCSNSTYEPLVIYGLAADSVGRTLYFTDRANSIIGSLSLDGGGTVQVVTATGVHSKPTALVLAINSRLLFWTDVGATPRIVRANMDGSGVTTIISGANINAPSALAVDTTSKSLTLIHYACIHFMFSVCVLFAANTLFWADHVTMRVESATFSGTRILIYQSAIEKYVRLSVDSNFIYLSTLSSR